MSHRGRLNVMTNTIGRAPSEIFAKFEDVDPRSTLGGGDVKYHMGGHRHLSLSRGQGDRPATSSRTRAISKPSTQSPSGAHAPSRRASAKTAVTRSCLSFSTETQPSPVRASSRSRLYSPRSPALTWAERSTSSSTISSALPLYPRNQTPPALPSDMAKRLPIPIFHVNAEDVDAVVRVARLAAEYRHEFHSDVVTSISSAIAGTATAKWTTRP